MINKIRTNFTIDITTYHQLRHAIPDGKMSDVVNTLLEQFLQVRETHDFEETTIKTMIEDKTKQFEQLSAEITSLKIQLAEIIRQNATKEKEQIIQAQAWNETIKASGVLNDILDGGRK